MSKQEVIRKAYGEYWERLTELQKTFALENNGRTCLGYSSEEKRLFNEIYKSGLFDTQPIRPKSLQGIENNNGWTKIESEDWLKSVEVSKHVTTYYVDSPDDDYFDIAIQLDDTENGIVRLSDYLFMLDELTNSNIKATHYMPITKPLKPIY